MDRTAAAAGGARALDLRGWLPAARGGRAHASCSTNPATCAATHPHLGCRIPGPSCRQWVLAPGQDVQYATEGGAKVIRFPSDMVGA